MSTVALLFVLYYALNIALTWYYAGRRETMTYTPGLAVFYTVVASLLTWGVLHLDKT